MKADALVFGLPDVGPCTLHRVEQAVAKGIPCRGVVSDGDMRGMVFVVCRRPEDRTLTMYLGDDVESVGFVLATRAAAFGRRLDDLCAVL